MTEILNQTSKYYNVPIELMLKKTREQRIVRAKYMVCTLSKELTFLTYREIGDQLNYLPHNVYYGIDVIKSKIQKKGKTRSEYEELKSILNDRTRTR